LFWRVRRFWMLFLHVLLTRFFAQETTFAHVTPVAHALHLCLFMNTLVVSNHVILAIKFAPARATAVDRLGVLCLSSHVEIAAAPPLVYVRRGGVFDSRYPLNSKWPL
jgi:hypothetical protein